MKFHCSIDYRKQGDPLPVGAPDTMKISHTAKGYIEAMDPIAAIANFVLVHLPDGHEVTSIHAFASAA